MHLQYTDLYCMPSNNINTQFHSLNLKWPLGTGTKLFFKTVWVHIFSQSSLHQDKSHQCLFSWNYLNTVHIDKKKLTKKTWNLKRIIIKHWAKNWAKSKVRSTTKVSLTWIRGFLFLFQITVLQSKQTVAICCYVTGKMYMYLNRQNKIKKVYTPVK